MEKLVKILKEKNLKLTPQRLAILNFLDKKTHPTIEEIYEEVKKNFPSISLATIYKNINTLKEHQIVIELNPGGKLKYDINLVPHIHAICKNCGKIEDFYNEEIINNCKNSIEKSINKKIEKLDITFYIECDDCAKA